MSRLRGSLSGSASAMALALVAGAVWAGPPVGAPVTEANRRPTLVADLAEPHESGLASVTPFDIAALQSAWLDEKMFFAADDGINGEELWVTDGSPAGTRMVIDLCPGVCSGSPKDFVIGADAVGFVATDGETGHERWRSDGTAEGTWQIADLLGTLDFGFPPDMFALGKSWLLFVSGENGRDLLRVADVPGGFAEAEVIAHNDSFPLGAVTVDGAVFFVWDCPQPSNADCLWRSDGTAQGTSAWPTIEPLQVQPTVIGLNRWVTLDSQLFLNDDTNCLTSVSTQDPQSAPRPLRCGEFTRYRTPLNGLVYFLESHWTGVQTQELWSTDGTVAGTQRIPMSVLDGEELFILNRVADRLLITTTSQERGHLVWSSDGTADGTFLLLEPHTPPPPPPVWLTQFYTPVTAQENNVALLSHPDDSGAIQTWSTDGTVEGTRKLSGQDADVGGPSYSSPLYFPHVLGRPNFLLYPVDPNLWDYSLPTLWATDGSADGTQAIINPARGSSWPQQLHRGPDGELLFFTRTDGAKKLWRHTEAVVQPIGGDVPTFDLYLGERDYASTAAGTFYRRQLPYDEGGVILVLRSESDSLEPFLENDAPFGDLRSSGDQLLVPLLHSPPNPWQVVDPETGSAVSTPADARENVQTPVFRWRDATYLATVDGLWAVDREGNPGLVASGPTNTGHFEGGNEDLFFTGASPSSLADSLWVSDGTSPGTVEILPKAGSPELRVFEGFEDLAGIYSRQWFTPLEPPRSLVTIGDRVFFAAESPDSGVELWSTARGAQPTLVKDLAPGADSSTPRYFARFEDWVLFIANDGEHGEELWASDGTMAGTFMVHDLNPGPVGSRPRELTLCGDALCFSAYKKASGRELWRVESRPSAWGPDRLRIVRLSDIAPGPESSSPSQLFFDEATLYFAANDGEVGFELWKIELAAPSEPIFSDGFESGSTAAWSTDPADVTQPEVAEEQVGMAH